MPVTIDPIEFNKSITRELLAVYKRTRSLIGNAHWGEEGRYKEAVLRNIIRKFLTEDDLIGTGFVVNKSGGQIKVTNQIDILIINKNSPVLFSEGEFIITTPSNVKAIIEVKSCFEVSDTDVIKKATANGELIGYGSEIFNGIFSFENDNPNFENERFKEVLKESKGLVNHICMGDKYFIKYWDNFVSNPAHNLYRFYEINEMAFSYFIFNLVERLYPNTSLERNWFMYPIVEGKESHAMMDVTIE